MKSRKTVLAAVIIAASILAFGHHSFQARYDEKHQATVTGTITKVLWQNPHVRVDIDAKSEAGVSESWELELDSPNLLMSQGWRIDSLKIGDQITAEGFRAAFRYRGDPADWGDSLGFRCAFRPDSP